MTLGEKPNNYQKRIYFLLIFIVSGFLILFMRLWQLQILQSSTYSKMSKDNRFRHILLEAPRGSIRDRNDQILTDNRPCFNVVVTPEDVSDENEIVNNLSSFLKIEPELIAKKLHNQQNPGFIPALIKEDISFQEVALIETHKNELAGVNIQTQPRRRYRYDNIAGHLLGYIGEISAKQLEELAYKGYRKGQLLGKFGLEKHYDRFLQGQDGGKLVEVNAEGREIRVMTNPAPQSALPGKNLYLSLDLGLQMVAEKCLSGKCGAIVAMDPRQGQILALASSPSYDPNIFAGNISAKDWQELNNNPDHPLLNRAIQAEYNPGSIFKIVLAATGLSLGEIKPTTTFFCGGGFWFGGREYHCWKAGGHGSMDLHRAIVNSCNVYFYNVGQILNMERIASFASQLGLGQLTGVDLPQEKPGLIPSPSWKKKNRKEPWWPGETISASIGQGYVLVTPIQICNLFCAIANGGTLYQPYCLTRIEDTSGTLIQDFQPQPIRKIPLSEKQLEAIRDSLRGVVNEGGTGGRARLNKIVVAGKTGTAQVVHLSQSALLKEKPELFNDHGWFAAFAPYKNPTLVVCIIIEHGGHGGACSAPIAKQLFEYYFLGKSSYPEESQEETQIVEISNIPGEEEAAD